MMKEVIEEILTGRQLAEEFQRHEFYYLKVQAPRPNVLEVIKSSNKVRVREVTNSDYQFITGDLVASPEMELEVVEDGLWVPSYLREGSRPGRRSVEYVDGCRVVREVRQRNQRKFEKAWAEKLSARDYQWGLVRSATGQNPNDLADNRAALSSEETED